MNVFDICSIAIALVAITNVRRGSADNLCMDTLRTVFVNNGQENTELSFQMAYKKLSTSSIMNMFNYEEEDLPEIQDTKIQQRNIVYNYMMDLYAGRTVSLTDFGIETPTKWCRRVVAEYTTLNQYINVNEEMNWYDVIDIVLRNNLDDTIRNFVQEMRACERCNTNYLFQHERNKTNPNAIFKKLYEKWNEDFILDIINSHCQDGRQISANFMERYALGYFRYIERYVNPPIHADNNFRTIEMFCTN